MRFAPGEGCARLAEPQITEADVEQRVQFVRNARHISEKPRRFINRHVQDISDIFSFISDLERLAVVAAAAADLALHVNIGQEMHLDFDQSAALAILAAAAFHVETKPAGVVTAHPRSRQLRKQFADRGKSSGVGDRVRARGAADRALIDYDRFVDLLDSAQRGVRARFFFRIVKTAEQRAPHNVIDQARFAAAGHTGHACEESKRECDLDVFQIVFGSAFNDQPAVVVFHLLIPNRARPGALFRHRNAETPGKIIGCE